MKQKLLATLLAVLTLCLSLVGCSCENLYNCVDTRCTSCFADAAECTGCLIDCGDCMFAFFLGEECTDTCLVAPCYQCAGCIRSGRVGPSYATRLIKELEPLNEGDYYVTAGCGSNAMEAIDNLENYFKLTVSVTVESWVTIKDVVVDCSVEDNYGNQMNHVCLYIADCIEPGGSTSQTQFVTLTFSKANGLNEDFSRNESDNSSLSFLGDGEDPYIVKVTVNGVYGRY